MKKFVSITIILMLTISFLIIGTTKAEAMNNESAAMLAGAIAIFGKPILSAIAQDIMHPGHAYAPAYPAQYRYAYPATRYIDRTKIIYVQPRPRMHEHRGWAYGNGYHDEWCRHEHHRGKHDARRDYRDYRDYDY